MQCGGTRRGRLARHAALDARGEAGAQQPCSRRAQPAAAAARAAGQAAGMTNFVLVTMCLQVSTMSRSAKPCFILRVSFFANKMNHMADEERAAHDAIIESIGLTLPTPIPSIEAVKARAMADSKRGVVGEGNDEFSP